MNSDDEVFASIWVDFGSLAANGLPPGSAEKRLMMTGEQLSRLAERFQSWEVVHALGLIVEHGELALNPARIEVPGWSQAWLEEHGMSTNHARKANSLLKRSGFMTKVYGQRGAAGGATGVLAGGHFGWVDAVTEVVTERGRTRLMVVPDAVDNSAKAQVSPRFAEMAQNAVATVDNPRSTFGGFPTERGERIDRSDENAQNAGSAERQVSAIGRSSTERIPRPGPSKEEEEGKSLLSDQTGEVGPLTRTSLHQFLSDPAIIEALRSRPEAEVIDALSQVYAAKPDRTVSALDFFDRQHGDPDRGDRVDADLAAFVFDLLTLHDDAAEQVAEALRTVLWAKSARVPRYATSEMLCSSVLALTVSMDSDVESWPSYVVWAMKQERLNSSAALSALVRTINELVSSGTSSNPRSASSATVDAPTPVSSRREIPGLPRRSPAVAPPTVVDEEMAARGDDYWDWLREVAQATEFGDDITFETVVRRSRNVQSVIIRQYRDAQGPSSVR